MRKKKATENCNTTGRKEGEIEKTVMKERRNRQQKAKGRRSIKDKQKR